MAGAQIGLIVLFLFFYIFTRTVWLVIVKNEGISIELHLPLLALYLRKKKSTQGKKEKDLPAGAIIRILPKALDRIRNAEADIDMIALPLSPSEADGISLLKPISMELGVFAAIGYLRSRIKRLTLRHNAIILSPDVKQPRFHITLKLPLYQLIYAILTIIKGVNNEMMHRRKKCQRIK